MEEVFKKRKNKLMKLTLNSNLTNEATIYTLIKKGIIDHLIVKLNDIKTYTNSKSIVKKGYLTSEEQFLDILNNFISIYYQDFCYVGKYKELILENILRNDKKNMFFLCKHYWGDNEFIPYFNYNIKRFIIMGFYMNLKVLNKESEQIQTMLRQKRMKINNLCLSHTEDVNKLYNLLITIASCNSKEYCLMYLFDDITIAINEIENQYHYGDIKSKSITINHYVMQWERLIENYYNKKDIIIKII